MGEKKPPENDERTELVLPGEMSPVNYKHIKESRRARKRRLRQADNEENKETRKARRSERRRKFIRTARTVGPIALLAVTAAAVGGNYFINRENERNKLAVSRESGEMGGPGTTHTCLNRVIMLRSGVVIRKTPDTIDAKLDWAVPGHKLFPGNVDSTVPHYAILVKPFISRDGEWVGATKDDPSIELNSQKDADNVAVATDWVNAKYYLDLKNPGAKDKEGSPTYKALSGTGPYAVPCQIGQNGKATIEGKKAAYMRVDPDPEETLEAVGYDVG